MKTIKRKRSKDIDIFKEGAKVRQLFDDKSVLEWEIDRVNKDSIVLKTLWQGSGVPDEESLVCYREIPKSNLCVACGTIIPEKYKECPNCLNTR